MSECNTQNSQPTQSAQQLLDDPSSFAMLMHFSQFATFFIPLFGCLIPLIMWFLKKDIPEINQHGKFIANWMISCFIYSLLIIAVFWFMPLLSIPALLLFGACSMVLIVLAALNAKKGKTKPYPLAIPFFN